MREPIDLNLLCAHSREAIGQALGANVQLKLEVTTAPCLVLAERSELELLLLDLALSARRAMPEAAVLTIRLSSVVEVPPGLKHPHVRARSYARISVGDGSGANVTADLPCIDREGNPG